MPIPYEILIRANDLSEFQGAHAIDTPGGTPRKVTKADLKDIAPAINAASLVMESAIATLETTHAAAIALKDAEITAAKAALESARTIARDGGKTKDEKLDEIKDTIAAALLTDKQRKRQAIQDEIAKLNAALAAEDAPQ